MSRRVVITGIGLLCPLGQDWPAIGRALRAKVSGIIAMPEWKVIKGLRTLLGAAVPGFDRPEHYSRKKTRSMGRVSLLAARATELALEAAGLPLESPGGPRTGLAYGSTSGSPPALEYFVRQLSVNQTMEAMTATEFIKSMSHTCVINLAQFFNLRGRIIPSCSACTSGSQAIGAAYEIIKAGRVDLMIAGGAEELHVSDAAVFDLLLATSTRNDQPSTTPRPFDTKRDGLVVGEGAGTLILEALDHAQQRGATPLAEIVGYASNCDGAHIVHPSADGMREVMSLALDDAGLSPDHIDYVNAHATATEVGDIAESAATRRCFERAIPISSLKGCMGHTLGACGALDAGISAHQLREGWVAPTVNLDDVDPRCADLDYVTQARDMPLRHIMSNNFAFGGINTSIILKKWEP